jgi:leader peptidase (prepilin peptidase)/N-methyltransferase
VIKPGSACPKCGHKLEWWENIPILSFLFLRAKCSYCGSKISLRYPLVELLSGFLALALWNDFSFSPKFFIYFYFSACLIIIIFIDLGHRIIPDVVSLPGIAVGFLSSFLMPDLSWLDSLLGILLGGGILFLVAWGYYIITHREGMGGGDIKLLAMIGAFLGWQAIPLIIPLSALAGSVTGLIIMSTQKGDRYTAIPYGPFLAGAALIILFWGYELSNWYLMFISK